MSATSRIVGITLKSSTYINNESVTYPPAAESVSFAAPESIHVAAYVINHS